MIILDTDFLISSIKFRVDVVSQIKENFPGEIAIMDKTIDELKGVNNPNSRAAIHLVKLKEMKALKKKLSNSIFREKYIALVNANIDEIFSGWWSEIISLEEVDYYEDKN